MDKAEYQEKLLQLTNLAEDKQYTDALAIVNEIDWKRVKSIRTLNMVADIYEATGHYDDAKRIMRIALTRAQVGRSILRRLVEVCIKLGEINEAEDYFEQYSKLASNDDSKLVLQYKLFRAKKAPIEAQIALLEEYRDREYTEKWAYELASLYAKAGDTEQCITACDDLILWFGEGKYVLKAIELKMQYTALSKSQSRLYQKEREKEIGREKASEAIRQEQASAKKKEAAKEKSPEEMKTALSESIHEVFKGIKKPSYIPEDAELNRKLENTLPLDQLHISELEPEEEFSGSISPVHPAEPILHQPDRKQDEPVSPVSDEIESLLKETAGAFSEELTSGKFETDIDAAAGISKEVSSSKQEKAPKNKQKDAKPSDLLSSMVQGAEHKPGLKQKGRLPGGKVSAPAANELTEEEEKAAQKLEALLQDETKETATVSVEEEPQAVEKAEGSSIKTQEQRAAEADDAERRLAELEAIIDRANENRTEEQESAQKADTTAAPDTAKEMHAADAVANLVTSVSETEDQKPAYSAFRESIRAALAKEEEKFGGQPIWNSPAAPVSGKEEKETRAEARPDSNPSFVIKEEPKKEQIRKPRYNEELEIPDPEPTEAEKLSHSRTLDLSKVGENTIPISLDELVSSETPEERRIRFLSKNNQLRMNDKQRRIFTYFARIPGMDNQILGAMSAVYQHVDEKTSAHGNLAVMGAQGTGKSRLARNIVSAMCEDLNLEAAKLARITGYQMNEKDPVKVVSKMAGGFLIIEECSEMNEETVAKLSQAMDFRTDRMILIIEDEKSAMRTFLAKYPDFARKIERVINIPIFTNDELITFARTYAEENHCTLDDMAILALYTIIGNNQSYEEPMTISRVKELIDKAISSAKGGKKRRGRRKGKSASPVVLHEKDFETH